MYSGTKTLVFGERRTTVLKCAKAEPRVLGEAATGTLVSGQIKLRSSVLRTSSPARKPAASAWHESPNNLPLPHPEDTGSFWWNISSYSGMKKANLEQMGLTPEKHCQSFWEMTVKGGVKLFITLIAGCIQRVAVMRSDLVCRRLRQLGLCLHQSFKKGNHFLMQGKRGKCKSKHWIKYNK